MQPDFRPKGIGKVIDDAVTLYRAQFRTVALPAAMLLLPTSLLTALLQAYYTRLMSSAFFAGDSSSPVSVLAGVGLAYAVLSLLVAVSSIVSLYYFNSLLQATPDLLTRRPVTPGAFFKGGFKRFPALMLVAVIVNLAVGAGLMLLVIPGLALMVYLSLAEVITVVEQAPFDRALRRSISLVSGHFWRIVGFFFGLGVIVWAMASAISSLGSIGLVLSMAGEKSGMPSLGAQVLSGLAQGIGQTITLPLAYLGWLLFYLDLRSRREGMDLIVRAQALAARSS